MSYFDYTKQFWRSGAAKRLSDSAFKLYFFLLDCFNRARWPQKLRISYTEIRKALQISGNTIKAAREQLILYGLISCNRSAAGPISVEFQLLDKKAAEVADVDTTPSQPLRQQTIRNTSTIETPYPQPLRHQTTHDISTIEVPPIPPLYIQDKNNPQDSLSKTGKRARDRGRSFEKDVFKKFDLDSLLPGFFAQENETLLERFACRNGIPRETLRPLAEEVVDEWLLARREFPDYPEAARALQNLMRAKYTHQQNQSKSQTDEEDTGYPDFGPDPFEGISPEFLRSLGTRRL